MQMILRSWETLVSCLEIMADLALIQLKIIMTPPHPHNAEESSPASILSVHFR